MISLHFMMIFRSQYEFNEEFSAVIFVYIDACHDDDSQTVNFLEQLQITPRIWYPYRGAVSMTIESPAGKLEDKW